MQGEKQKTEDASQILGPSDTGAIANKQLLKEDQIHVKEVVHSRERPFRPGFQSRLAGVFVCALPIHYVKLGT
jgi:hypothetical protein